MIAWFLLKMIVILLAISAFASCKSSEEGLKSEPPKVKAVFKQEVPGDSAGFDISRSEIQDMRVGESKRANGTKSTVKITRTAEDNYRVDCNTEPQIIEVAAEVTCPPVNIIQPEPQVVEITPWWNYIIIIGLLAMCAYLSFRLWLAGKTINIQLPDTHGKL